ncbi:MAG: Gfo/Idh/MocA family oxidoreductase [Thermomicrobiales bacterium]|nr:Gfo/Idh/MocA family oxidoreductase [Thermomicrobiales bacterium]
MIRIGIVGSDNSHALAFAKIANVERTLGDRCRVVGIWGADAAQARAIADETKIERVVERPDELVDQVDLAIVVDRHGDLHAEHGLPFIERGLPVFIDKPLAIDLADCQRMLDSAAKSGSALASFSALRFAPAIEEIAADLPTLGAIRAAQFAGPCDFASEYGGPFFYATHVIEMALRLVGEDLASVRAVRHADNVQVTAIWANGAIGTFALLSNADYHFHATLFGASGMTAREIFGGGPGYTNALDRIVRMAETGERPLANDQLLRPIQTVHAILASLDAGGVEIAISG